MSITDILKQLNISEKEISIYQAYLKAGEQVAAQIGRQLKIDKATTYRCVDHLTSLGLLVKHPKPKNNTYTASSPEILLEIMKQHRMEIDFQAKMLSDYVAKIIQDTQLDQNIHNTYINVEKGLDAHLKMMQLQLNIKEKIIRQKITADAQLYDTKQYPGYATYMDYLNEFIKLRIKKGIFLKQLTHTTINQNILPYNITDPKLHKEVRILPADIMKDISFKVFDEYFIITLHQPKIEDITIITIKDQLVSNLVKTLYDFIFARSIIYYGKLTLPKISFPNQKQAGVLGIGSSGIGGYWFGTSPYSDDLNDIAQIQHAISKGANYIDCCLMYGGGNTIKLIAQTIKNYPRAELFLTCKLTKVGGVPVKHSREIVQQCDRYLKELSTDYIDFFEIHGRSSLAIPRPEAAQAIEKLIDQGKVRMWGVSNYNIENLKEVMPANKYPLAANEIPYSLAHRAFEQDGTIDFCRQNNILNIAYFVLGKGLLTQYIETDEDNIFMQLIKKYNCTINQIAINWVLSKPNMMAIVKSTNATHINENYAKLDWRMTPKEYRALDKLVITNPWLTNYIAKS